MIKKEQTRTFLDLEKIVEDDDLTATLRLYKFQKSNMLPLVYDRGKYYSSELIVHIRDSEDKPLCQCKIHDSCKTHGLLKFLKDPRVCNKCSEVWQLHLSFVGIHYSRNYEDEQRENFIESSITDVPVEKPKRKYTRRK